MESLIRITQTDDKTGFYFYSCFPTEIIVKAAKDDFLRLGKLLIRLGRKKRGFTWCATVTASHGSFPLKVTGQKGPCLTFEYQIFNALFKTVSDCENFYNTASYEGVLQFGEEFSALESGKNATLYEFK